MSGVGIAKAISNLSDAQALMALRVFMVRLLYTAEIPFPILESEFAADPAIGREVGAWFGFSARTPAEQARVVLLRAIDLPDRTIVEKVEQAVADTAASPSYHVDPQAILAGGGVAVCFLFILLVKSIGRDGIIMRDEMPLGFDKVLKESGVLVEKITKLVKAIKN